ncbi:MAG: hypothetical protein ACRD0K_00005, partial [Egibacteraceae bacterium]
FGPAALQVSSVFGGNLHLWLERPDWRAREILQQTRSDGKLPANSVRWWLDYGFPSDLTESRS